MVIRRILEAIAEVELDISPAFKKKQPVATLDEVEQLLNKGGWDTSDFEVEEWGSMVPGSASAATTWHSPEFPGWWIVLREPGREHEEGEWVGDGTLYSFVMASGPGNDDYMLMGDEVTLFDIAEVLKGVRRSGEPEEPTTGDAIDSLEKDAAELGEVPSAIDPKQAEYNTISSKLQEHGWTLDMGTDEGYWLEGDYYADTDEPGGAYWEKWRHVKDPGRYVELMWEDDGPITVVYMMSPGHPTAWDKNDPDAAWMDEMLNAIAEW